MMEKPMTLCDRCEMQFSCLLNYDGVPCRKNRTVEPTNYDRIISKTPEELAKFLEFISWGCDYMSTDCPAYDSCELVRDQDDACRKGWLDWLKQKVCE